MIVLSTYVGFRDRIVFLSTKSITNFYQESSIWRLKVLRITQITYQLYNDKDQFFLFLSSNLKLWPLSIHVQSLLFYLMIHFHLNAIIVLITVPSCGTKTPVLNNLCIFYQIKVKARVPNYKDIDSAELFCPSSWFHRLWNWWIIEGSWVHWLKSTSRSFFFPLPVVPLAASLNCFKMRPNFIFVLLLEDRVVSQDMWLPQAPAEAECKPPQIWRQINPDSSATDQRVEDSSRSSITFPVCLLSFHPSACDHRAAGIYFYFFHFFDIFTNQQNSGTQVNIFLIHSRN